MAKNIITKINQDIVGDYPKLDAIRIRLIGSSTAQRGIWIRANNAYSVSKYIHTPLGDVTFASGGRFVVPPSGDYEDALIYGKCNVESINNTNPNNYTVRYQTTIEVNAEDLPPTLQGLFGGIDRVSLNPTLIKNKYALKSLKNIKEVGASNLTFEDVEGMTSLESVSICPSYEGHRYKTIEPLKTLPNLKKLYMENMSVMGGNTTYLSLNIDDIGALVNLEELTNSYGSAFVGYYPKIEKMLESFVSNGRTSGMLSIKFKGVIFSACNKQYSATSTRYDFYVYFSATSPYVTVKNSSEEILETYNGVEWNVIKAL